MIYRILFIFSVITLSNFSFSQQDEQSSVYMFNPLHFNAGYTGSRGAFTGTMGYRYQWVGMGKEAKTPQTQFLSFSLPLAGKALGVGMHMSNDNAGAIGRTSAFGDFAYSLRLNRRGTRINFGASAGVDMLNLKFFSLNAVDKTETQYLQDYSQASFNAGLGVYYHSRHFYAGASLPRIVKTTWNTANLVKRHVFVMLGYVKPINSVTDLKLSSLIKMVENAPFTVDVNASLFFYKTFWIGGMYRFNESFGANIAYQLKEKWMLGYAYDYVYNGLRKTGMGGTHEIMLTFDMNGRQSIYASPRYF
jgi:type IX secretion system PorP/SprF family membrane protein